MLTASMDTSLEKLFSELNPAFLEALVGIMIAIFAVVLMIAVAMYILQSIGLFSIAKRRGFCRPWLAWLPICRDWLLGAIADQYRFTRKNETTIQGPALAILQMIAYVLNIVAVIVFQSILPYIEELQSWSGKKVASYEYYTYFWPLERKVNNTMVFLNVLGVLSVIAILLYVILYFRAHHDLFASCRPEQKTVFLVLSILFPVLLPIFVFVCRNKNEGMPEGHSTVWRCM